MADVSVNILEPATSFDLLTLAELKTALGLPVADNSNDTQLAWLIKTNSAVISELTNRVFAKEKVRETWRDLGSRRVYLTHYPVTSADIESVTTSGLANLDWELEEQSGKLSIFSGRTEPIIVTYTGGFDLPTGAPEALKQATALMAGISKSEQTAAALTGVRMIAHKESRVMFHPPTAAASANSGGGSMSDTVTALLGHYVRHWI